MSPKVSNDTKWATSCRKGAPGGWPISSLWSIEMNSLQSQKLAVGSMVDQYTHAAIRNTITPKRLFKRVNFEESCCSEPFNMGELRVLAKIVNNNALIRGLVARNIFYLCAPLESSFFDCPMV